MNTAGNHLLYYIFLAYRQHHQHRLPSLLATPQRRSTTTPRPRAYKMMSTTKSTPIEGKKTLYLRACPL